MRPVSLRSLAAPVGAVTPGQTDAPATEEETDAPETTTSTPEETSESSESSAPQMLTAEGSSTVYPIANKGSSYWNSNAPPSDGEYWPPARRHRHRPELATLGGSLRARSRRRGRPPPTSVGLPLRAPVSRRS
ncbi:hypothetical protein C9J85_10935 [Haloferax sp. wsp5]|nr:hypothetical protein C9J85_10935 [Haloferax sp. wsp5]